MKDILSLGMVKGVIGGLVGTAIGMVFTVLLRLIMGLAPWSEGPVFTIGILFGITAYLIAAGVFRYWTRWAIHGQAEEEKRPKRTWMRYFNVDSNHKVIGMQYLVTALVFLPFAVGLQLVGRLDMTGWIPPFLSASAYDSVISDHGVVMLFIVVLPAFAGLINYFIPLLIGSRDVAFPHLNAFTYWLVPAAGLLTVFSFTAGGFDTGWTVYPPLSSSYQKLGMNLILIGVFLAGLSSILTAVNILTTIFTMRAPGMTLFRMPVFVWSTAATLGLSLVFTQFIAVAFLLVLFERQLGLTFFRPEGGGQPLLYQYLFWFYSHPAVYVFVLPGLGIISDLLPVFARKPLFGYRGVAVSSPGIALGGTIVFAHHMFASGMPAFLRVPFMITTVLVAVPTGVKVFAWIATMWLGKLRLTTALLFVLSSIIFFLIGGLTGVPLGIVPADLYLHDTYWVVGHFHAMLFGGFLLPLMGGMYYWFPKVTGRMLDERQGKVQWLLMTLGTLSIVVPMLGLGVEGMRRRVSNFDPGLGFQQLHIATAVGGFLVFAGIVILIVNMVRSIRHGELAGPNPWNARTLEWQVSSPPPEDNFIEIPQVLDEPHLYGVPGSRYSSISDTSATGKEGP